MRAIWAVFLLLLISCGEVKQVSEYTVHYRSPKMIEPFLLYDQDEAVVTERDLLGKWTLIFLGYTSCPDICPMTLSKMAKAHSQLSTSYPSNVWFVSVDPRRDTPAKRKAYINYFNPTFKAVSNEHSALFPLVRNMGLIYAINENVGDEYYVDHSASVALINPSGELEAIFKAKFLPNEVPLVDDMLLVSDFQVIAEQYVR